MEGIDIVFHCAAYVGYDPKESARVFKINLEGTANVVNNALAKGVKKLIYVSCNPATQARDLKLLSEVYEVVSVQPVDMFPHTSHVESIASLKLRK